MNITSAQREIRSVFLGGFAGQLVSGIIWLISSILSKWVDHGSGMLFLFFGGMLIYPATQLLLRLLGRKPKLSPDNPMNQLAMQIAFTVPVGFLLVGATSLVNQDWYYPAAMVVVGAHYLPFCFLYGMWQFAILAVLMIGGGVVISQFLQLSFTAGGWITAVLLFIAAVAGLLIIKSEQRQNKQFIGKSI